MKKLISLALVFGLLAIAAWQLDKRSSVQPSIYRIESIELPRRSGHQASDESVFLLALAMESADDH